MPKKSDKNDSITISFDVRLNNLTPNLFPSNPVVIPRVKETRIIRKFQFSNRYSDVQNYSKIYSLSYMKMVSNISFLIKPSILSSDVE